MVRQISCGLKEGVEAFGGASRSIDLVSAEADLVAYSQTESLSSHFE